MSARVCPCEEFEPGNCANCGHDIDWHAEGGHECHENGAPVAKRMTDREYAGLVPWRDAQRLFSECERARAEEDRLRASEAALLEALKKAREALAVAVVAVVQVPGFRAEDADVVRALDTAIANAANGGGR